MKVQAEWTFFVKRGGTAELLIQLLSRHCFMPEQELFVIPA